MSTLTKVDLSFLVCEGKQAASITLDELYQGVSGVYVCGLKEGLEVMPEVLKRTYSSGASALLFLGVLPADVDVHSDRVENVVVPVRFGKAHGAARAVLVQAGKAQVKCPDKKEVLVTDSQENPSVVTYQVYMEENPSLPDPMSIKGFLRALGFESHIYIKEVWATGWYKRGKKVERSKAEYFHGFLKVADQMLPALLKLSGRNGFYCASRNSDRSPDSRYRVVFLGGLTLEEARSRLRDIPNHFGLVKSKKGYGVRVADLGYDDAKKTLLPGAPVSSDSDAAGPRKFTVMGLPTNTDRSKVKKVLRAFGWKVKVQKQIGYQSWLVSSQEAAPSRNFQYDEATVVISEDVESQTCLVAGDQKTWRRYEMNAVTTEGVRTAAVGLRPDAKGDDETSKRFTLIEGQIATLRAEQKTAEQRTSLRIEEIGRKTGEVSTKVVQMRDTVDGFSQVVQQQLHEAFTRFTQASDSRLDEFSRTHQEAIRRVEAASEERLKEIQEIITQSPKVRAVSKNP